jgi:hypothetical protein
MVSSNPNIFPVVLNNYISVKAAALYSSYSLQYLRRMLRSGKLLGLKVGRLWLMEKIPLMQTWREHKYRRSGDLAHSSFFGKDCLERVNVIIKAWYKKIHIIPLIL